MIGITLQHPLDRAIVVWCLVSPLVWTIPGMPGTVKLTLVANSVQVVLMPVLAGGLWWITAHRKYIGDKYCNHWWENAVMAVMFALAVFEAYQSIRTVASYL